MAPSAVHLTTHEIEIDAPPAVVYGVIENAAAWPHRFCPNLHVEQVPITPGSERLQIWATANGAVKSWTSVRELDPGSGRISFRQEVSAPPVESMAGTWTVAPTASGGTNLSLTHEFSALGDDPEGVAWIRRAVEENSGAELANIRQVAQQALGLEDLTFSFEDQVGVRAAPDEVYEFVNRADLWPQRLPHVGSLELREDVPGIQFMTMQTRTSDGSTHITESIRVCLAEQHRILYKQVVTPALMRAHTGEWTFRPQGDGTVIATSRHTVVVNDRAIGQVLGEEADLGAAKTFLRRALGDNSLATLRLAKSFVESNRADR